MARYTGNKNRIARRYGVNIFGRARNPLLHKPNPPGQHGARRRKKSDYGLQLEEKQKLKAEDRRDLPPLLHQVKVGLEAQEKSLLAVGLTVLADADVKTLFSTLLVVSLIALHQLIGPVLFRAALSRAGEIGRMDAAG